LADDLGRTVDSVRKQAKKLGLERTRKSDRKGPPKKRGRKPIPKTIFHFVDIGHKNRRKRERKVEAKNRETQRKIREYQKVKEELEEKVIPPAPDTSQSVCYSIVLNGRECIMYSKTPERMRKAVYSFRNKNSDKRLNYGNYTGTGDDFI
jgi:hypothetical protein